MVGGSVVLLIAGILLMASAQFAKATVATAENTDKILQLLTDLHAQRNSSGQDPSLTATR